EGRIAPGAGDDPGADRRAAAVHLLDLAADLVGGQHPLLDQELPDRFAEALVIADLLGPVGQRRMLMVMAVRPRQAVVMAHDCSFSGRLQPVLEDLDVDAVAVAAAIVRPDRALGEANAIER